MNNELRTTNYRLNTSDERQATCDEFALFWSFYVSFCTFCASLWLKNPFNQRNLRLINDLRSTKDYVRKNKLFLQNEPKFQKSQMNVNKELTRNYDQMDTWSIRKNEPKTNPNEPKTNPNEPKSKKAKMNVTSYITMEYENKSNWAICENEPNSNPTCRGVASGEDGTNPISPPPKPVPDEAQLLAHGSFSANIGHSATL